MQGESVLQLNYLELTRFMLLLLLKRILELVDWPVEEQLP